MRSIAILNQKGGVGKTSTAVNVSAALARDGLRVLLIDLDPQCHASLHVGIEPDDGAPSVYDALMRGVTAAEAARDLNDHLVVIPAHLDLVSAEIELVDRDARERVLADALRPFLGGFDYCVIDCAPSLGLLTVNALTAVEEVVIPLQPHFLALQGLGRLLETVALVHHVLNPALRVTGIVLCMYETGTRLAQEVRDDVTRFMAEADAGVPWHGARVFSTVIRRNIKLAECPSFGQPVLDYAPGSHGAQDYTALARELHTGRPEAQAEEPAGGSTAPVVKPAEEVLPANQRDVCPTEATLEAPPTLPPVPVASQESPPKKPPET